MLHYVNLQNKNISLKAIHFYDKIKLILDPPGLSKKTGCDTNGGRIQKSPKMWLRNIWTVPDLTMTSDTHQRQAQFVPDELSKCFSLFFWFQTRLLEFQ